MFDCHWCGCPIDDELDEIDGWFTCLECVDEAEAAMDARLAALSQKGDGK